MVNEDTDRRVVVKFTTLRENEEKAVVSELISWMYYYYLKTSTSKNPDSHKVFEYYNKNIKKPYTIQSLLEDFNVKVDAINYIEETYDMVVLIMSNTVDERQKAIIDSTKDYNRKHHLNAVIYLLNKNKENEKVKDIIDYLKKHRINKRNISDDYIKRIVNKVYQLM